MTATSYDEDDEEYTFTVQRGQRGTTAASHDEDDVAFLLLYDHEEDYLREHPNYDSAFRVLNNPGKTQAYIDNEGNLRLRGMVFEGWTGWGLFE